MKDDTTPDVSKTPQERFQAFGKKLMSVPKAVIDQREKKWQRARKHRKRT